ncbi:MAG: GMC oxidoreductase, partial [Steroidobacteraceae bacterium]
LSTVLAPLPVERIEFRDLRATESHIQGSLRMGVDPASSVVDSRQVHHRVRNLVVVGSAVFPSCSCSNPSLTVAALSLRSAALLA